jgi:putative transposase
MEAEFAGVPEERRRKELARRIETYCDAGHGSCALRNGFAASAAQRVLFEKHGTACLLHHWAIMPNHVHLLATPLVPLGELLHLLKGSTSRAVNQALRRSGTLWQPDYFDRLIRDERHFDGVARYIEWNPVKARLCTDPKLWTWSSANPHTSLRLQERAKARGPYAG